MIGTRVRDVDDKTRCDLCKMHHPCIGEYRFQLKFVADYTCGCPHDGKRRHGCTARHAKRHETVTHWIDLRPPAA